MASRQALYAAVIKSNSKERIVITKNGVSESAMLPDFMEMLAYIMEKSAIRLKTSAKQVKSPCHPVTCILPIYNCSV